MRSRHPLSFHIKDSYLRNSEDNLKDIGFPPCSIATMDCNLASRSLLNFHAYGNSNTSQVHQNTYPQSSGKAEQAVKMTKVLIKRALKSNSDHYLALLDFCSTPIQGMETSPAQCLMSRRTKTLLPTKELLVVTEVPDMKDQKKLLMKLKE